MTRAEILYLISLIPDSEQSPYADPRAMLGFNNVKGEARDLLQKFNYLMMQPDLASRMTWVFARADLPMPNLSRLPEQKRRWLLALYSIQQDAYRPSNPIHNKVWQAVSLTADNRDVARDAIDSALFHDGYSYETIGRHFSVPGEVIEIYGHLFWNVRERIADRDYIVSLVYPTPSRRLAYLRPGYLLETTQRRLLMQEAYNHDVETMLVSAGLQPRVKNQSEETTRVYKNEAMWAALEELRLGGGHGTYPGMIQANRLIQAETLSGQEQQNNEDAIGLTSISKFHPVMECVKRMTDPGVHRMLLESQGEANKMQNIDGKEKLPPSHKPEKNWQNYDDLR